MSNIQPVKLNNRPGAQCQIMGEQPWWNQGQFSLRWLSPFFSGEEIKKKRSEEWIYFRTPQREIREFKQSIAGAGRPILDRKKVQTYLVNMHFAACV